MTGANDLARIVHWIKRRNIQFVAGVPCSWLDPLIQVLQSLPTVTYISAVNETLAVAHAAGATLAGRRVLVLCQNSGIGYLINPITSLLKPYGLTCDFIISNRIGTADEPQHIEMESATNAILEAIGIKLIESHDLDLEVKAEDFCMTALILRHKLDRTTDQLQGEKELVSGRSITEGHTDRRAYLDMLMGFRRSEELLVTSTGYISRDAFNSCDSGANFYMLGSMGCAAAIGLTLASETGKTVYVVDGDGSLLMHLGIMPAIASSNGCNICHVVLNNGCYESTGGQPTVGMLGFACGIARAVGYRAADFVNNVHELQSALLNFRLIGGPYLIECKTSIGSQSSRVSLDPNLIAQRFREVVAIT